MMNATANPAARPQAMTTPAAAHGVDGVAAATSHADPRTMPPRPSVWDERARKMGFPPSSR